MKASPVETKSSSYRVMAATLAVCVVLVVIAQIARGSFTGEFGDDEASHYISGLLIHDYLRDGLGSNPVAYLVRYHSHYPLVGIGHWGPAFYGLEALWMLIFSPSRVSVIALSAVITVATAGCVFYFGKRYLRLSDAGAGFAAIAFMINPVVQIGASEVMLDIPITLSCILAALAYTRYLETEGWLPSLLFGVAASAALLIKGNGALLALLPPFAILLSGKWHLLARPSFWAPAVLVVVLTGPWYYFTYSQVSPGFRYSWGLDYTSVAIPANAQILFHSVGPLVLLLAALGLWRSFTRRKGADAVGVSGAVALLLATWTFQSLAPAAIQERYLAPLLPPVLLLAALGAETIAGWIAASKPARFLPAMATMLAVALLSTVPAALAVAPKPREGIRELAPLVWANRDPQNPVVLISAKNTSEAAALAEIAMLDPARPSMIAVRGSRLLGGGGYNRLDYQPKFPDAARVAEELETLHVPLVLHQNDPDVYRHISQLDAVRAAAAPPWQVLGSAGATDKPFMLLKRPSAAGHKADIKRWLEITGPRALQ